MGRLKDFYQPIYWVYIAAFFVIIVGMGLPLKTIPIIILTVSFATDTDEEIKDDMMLHIPLILGIGIIAFVSQFVNRFIIHKMSQKCLTKIRKKLNESILSRPLKFFNEEGNSSGELTAILSEDVQEINTNTLELYLLILQGFVGLLTGVV